MTKFMAIYHGGRMPATPEEGQKTMAAWNSWISKAGKALVDPGNPVGKSSTVGVDGKLSAGGGSNPTMGYSILQAASLEDAAKLVRDCPQLAAGGTIELAEVVEM